MKKGFAQRLSWFLIMLLASSGIVLCQQGTSSSTASVDQEKEEQDAKEQARKKAEQAKRQRPFSDGIFSDIENGVGISIGLFENYDSNIFFSDKSTKQADSYTLIYPRLFGVLQKGHLHFTADYRGGYRIYNRFSDLNTFQHAAGVGLDYQSSPQTSIGVSDQFSYAPDTGFGPAREPSSLPGTEGIPSPRIITSFQQVYRNTVEGNMTHFFDETTNVNIFGGYSLARYRDLVENNFDRFNAGFQFVHRPSRKLALNTEYEFVDFEFNNQFEASRIHRIGFGFTYALRPSVSLYGLGGPQLTSQLGLSRVDGFFEGGVTKSTSSTRLTIGYSRRMEGDLGVATILRSQSVGMALEHRLTERLNFSIDASFYHRTPLTSTATKVNGGAGGLGMQYAVRHDLWFSTGYSYSRQKSDVTALGARDITRHFVFVGIEYRPPIQFR